MRPLRITMQAFASYGNETTIDLTRPDQNLFLITGDTGSGKTTIFDAIVFALYGEASSGNNRKDGEELQSQYAQTSVQPYTELEFSEQSAEETLVYTIRRVPRHKRPLMKGSGIKSEKETVSLIMPDGTEYSPNARETDAKIQEIVGLNKDQFMQVAMIAQGEFMELLRAKSDDRKVVFRKLFNTGFYEEIVEELGRRKREKMVDLGRIRTVFQTIAGHVLVPEDYAQAAQMKETKKRILAEERLSTTDIEDLLSQLQEVCAVLAEETGQARAVFKAAEAERDKKRDEYKGAEELIKFFLQLDQAQKTLDACIAEEPETRTRTEMIGKIRTAYDLKNVHQRYADSRAVTKNTAENLKIQQERLPLLEQDRKETAEAEEKTARVREAASREYTRIQEKADKTKKAFEALEGAVRERKEKEQILNSALKAEETANTALADLENKEQAWRRGVEERKDADKELELWKRKSSDADAVEKQISTLGRAEKEMEAAGKEITKTSARYEAARDAYGKANADYLLKQNQFLDAQAGFLAAHLEEGVPCPVCGSVHHPAPCSLAEEHRELTREVLDRLSGQVERLRKEQEAASEAAGSAVKVYEERKGYCDTQAGQLFEQMNRLLEDLPEYAAELASVKDHMESAAARGLLQKRKNELQEEGEHVNGRARELHQLRANLEGIDQKKEDLRNRAQAMARKSVDAKTALAGVEASLLQLRVEAVRDYPSVEEADRALREAKKLFEEAHGHHLEARRKAQEAGTREDNAKTLIRRYSSELPAQKDQEEERRQAYEAMLGEKDFSETEWKLITGRYEKEEADRLQASIDDYGKKKAAAEGLKLSSQEAIGGRSRPVLEDLKEQMLRAEEQREAARISFESRRDHLRADQAALDELAPKMEERRKEQAEYSRIEGMYNRLAGKVSGARMDIETFVQRYYLERILRAANRRFTDMSAGQFELRMYDAEKAGEGRNHGLDLMVYSTVTGKEREVRTLSGGESFMAALSLALGMADQIQENSASVNLDVMFIDEGFGSLDEHSRDQAVRVLKQMAGGSRLIGIISHVTELKQELEDQLIVSKDEEGSHVKWQIS